MLKRNYIYRFKTKEEFVNEFGDSWRGIPGYFSYEMDGLLGKEIGETTNENHYDIFDELFNHPNNHRITCYHPRNFSCVYVSKEMILKVTVKPNYKSKKLIKC